MPDAPLARPDRNYVAANYDRGVDGYINVWSPVILPAAQAVVAAMGLRPRNRVIDVGTGTGTLVPSIRDAAPGGEVVGVDASLAMLRAARGRTPVAAAQADALALPVRDGCADAVVLAFVLFHLSDPVVALDEARRVLRDSGTVGTVTWAREATLTAFTVFDEALSEAGAPALQTRRVDVGLDSPAAVEATLAEGGLETRKAWVEHLSHQWTAETYWSLATGCGSNQLRIDALDEGVRAEVLDRARRRLGELGPADFAWSGDVVCAIATPRPRRRALR